MCRRCTAERKAATAQPETASVSRLDMQKVKKAMQDVMMPLRYTSAEWQMGRLPTLPYDYQYPDAKPGEKVGPKAVFGHDVTLEPGQTTIQGFADRMTHPQNPLFTTVIANRMWKRPLALV
jgi:hypothetical protein